MKIIASIPQGPYNDPHFIAEVSVKEIEALLALSSYSEIKVTSSGGVESMKRPKDFLPGDTIDPSVSAEAINAIREVRSAKAEISKASASLRGALTKLGNTLP